MTADALDELKRLSRLMQWACLIAIAVVLIAITYTVTDVVIRPAAVTNYFDAGAAIDADRITRTQVVLAAAVNIVTIAFICRALFALWQMFGVFRAGHVLHRRTARLIRSAGSNFLGAALWGIVANTLTVVILTINNAPGERQINVNLSTDQLFPLLMAGTLFAVGHVLTAAAAIDEENRAFV
ncbi:MAG: hypothetical protein NXH91_11515 [Phyllobacteriaceae bacterium]|nr:hypothetical protein [Phyllobacteriaceae bacterium]